MKRCPTATPTYRNPTTVQRHCPCCWLLKNLHTWGGGSWELSLEISPGLIPTECIFVINCLIPVSDVFEWRNKYRSIAMQVESTQGVQCRNWSLTKRTSQQQQSREMVATTNNASRRLILKLKYWGLYNSFTGDWTVDGTHTQLLFAWPENNIPPLIWTSSSHGHSNSSATTKYVILLLNKGRRSVGDISIAPLFCV